MDVMTGAGVMTGVGTGVMTGSAMTVTSQESLLPSAVAVIVH